MLGFLLSGLTRQARKDYKFCTNDGAYGTLIPTLADKINGEWVAFHHLCLSHEVCVYISIYLSIYTYT